MKRNFLLVAVCAALLSYACLAQSSPLPDIANSANQILADVTAAQNLFAGLSSTISQDNDMIAANKVTISQDIATMAAQSSQISSLTAQLAAAQSVGTVIPKVSGGLQDHLPWNQNGNVGNSGGGSNAPHGTYTEVMDANGVMSTFSIVPSVGPTGKGYDNYYFSYKGVTSPKAGKYRFIYHMAFQFRTPGDEGKSQAYEFELQWSDGSYTYNMAWQANLAQKVPTWRYFHYTGTAGTGYWVDSTIPVDVATLQAGNIEDVYATFVVDSATHTVEHENLQLNGTMHVVNFPDNAVALGESNYVRVANQLDSKGIQTGAVLPPAYAVSFLSDVVIVPLQ